MARVAADLLPALAAITAAVDGTGRSSSEHGLTVGGVDGEREHRSIQLLGKLRQHDPGVVRAGSRRRRGGEPEPDGQQAGRRDKTQCRTRQRPWDYRARPANVPRPDFQQLTQVSPI
jgi:hypothetical protein